jgi:hypothetical protein
MEASPALAPTTVPIPDSSETGTLKITSTPSRAAVYLDGNYRGLTPVTLLKISSGTHQLRLAKSGYLDYSSEMNVPAGNIATIPVRLSPGREPEPTSSTTSTPTQTPPTSPAATIGSLTVTSSPSGAAVYLDSRYKGISPCTLAQVSPGTHMVTVKKQGYSDYVTTAMITGDEITTVAAVLHTNTGGMMRISP